MKRLIVREEHCIGCHLCEIWCAVEHSESKNLISRFNRETDRPVPRVRVEENKPTTFLASGTGIHLERGMVVDEAMMTSVPGIYAAGDCAQVYDFPRQDKRVLAIWAAAYVGGMVARYNMAGSKVTSRWSTSMNSMNILGRSVLSAGIVNAGEGGGLSELSTEADGTYRKLVVKDGIIEGFLFLEGGAKAGLYLQMMRNGTSVARLKRALLSDSFGLAHLPERERRKISEGA